MPSPETPDPLLPGIDDAQPGNAAERRAGDAHLVLLMGLVEIVLVILAATQLFGVASWRALGIGLVSGLILITTGLALRRWWST